RIPHPASRDGNLLFFSAHEFATVRVLADMVIPRDARSGSATDAGVPEFMDFIMIEYPIWQTPIRGGLAWLDAESRRRHSRAFLDLTDAERRGILDDIAYPARARPEMSHGVEFFTKFRDLTASGFWSSRMGVEDLRYQGNTLVQEWTGCPDPALRKLGVAYDP
ncbi:MAG TPA: gluconate 2-dehydrogenase subunit 3 family protein, partial [Gemmatimonadaceae bacterium]|nr:gluconate 2-dehydrogenase subunit 3 family protein [Gemmatimonadaceae bacterium]